MTIAEWGSLGELLGAIATVATLFYLALQIRENTRQNRRAGVDGAIDRIVRWQARRAGSDEMLHAWIDGQKSYENLSEEDQIRFESMMAEALATAETTLEAGKLGSIKEETVARTHDWIRGNLEGPGALQWWRKRGQHIFAADFVEEVERSLSDRPREGVSDSTGR